MPGSCIVTVDVVVSVCARVTPPLRCSVRHLMTGPVKPRAMTFEIAPSQAREHRCDPVGAVDFLYGNDYIYVHDMPNPQLARSGVQPDRAGEAHAALVTVGDYYTE